MATWIAGVAQQSWDTSGGSFTGGPPKGVLHTTETSGWPGYQNGKTCPHFTMRPNMTTLRLEIRQHVPVNVAARALVNNAGGVQTNRDSAIQIELVGTCNPEWEGRAGYLYWPKAPMWALDQLRAFMRKLEASCGIRSVAVSPWLPYPSSYGNKRGQRLTLSQWDAYSGWLGHQHVPENTHGDPGNLNIAALMQPIVAVPTVPAQKPPPTVGVIPRFPLPKGHSFGPRTGPSYHHSGYYSANDRAGLRIWQAQMRKRGWTIDVDGLYGPQTARVARQFQTNKKLRVDGLIGPQTWSAAWTAPKE